MTASRASHHGNIVKRLGVWALVVVAILIIPLIANFPWTGSDFIFGAVMLFGSATVYELATRNLKTASQRYIVAVIVLSVLVFVWGLAATGE